MDVVVSTCIRGVDLTLVPLHCSKGGLQIRNLGLQGGDRWRCLWVRGAGSQGSEVCRKGSRPVRRRHPVQHKGATLDLLGRPPWRHVRSCRIGPQRRNGWVDRDESDRPQARKSRPHGLRQRIVSRPRRQSGVDVEWCCHADTRMPPLMVGPRERVGSKRSCFFQRRLGTVLSNHSTLFFTSTSRPGTGFLLLTTLQVPTTVVKTRMLHG